MNTSVPTRNVVAEFPVKFEGLFKPARYKVLYGGRGGAKSWNAARALILLAANASKGNPERILCARELQNSIDESVHRLLEEQISQLGLGGYFNVGNKRIFCPANGSEFIFAGIRNNVTKIKSMEGVTRAWVEEAERVSARSWEVLIPTIRKPGSEIWVTFNPDKEDDPTYKRFVVNPPPDSWVQFVSWKDNPWFPEELRREKDYLYKVDPDAAEHVWGGHTREITDAQIFKGKYVVEGFTPERDWSGPYYGADWGFAKDPSVAIRLWIHANKLYIEHEAYGVGVDIDKTPALFDKVPEARNHVIRADSARPETISYMKRNGYPRIESVEKWAGSVEDGIAHLRGYEAIVIHPRCTHAADEARLYSYKVDKLSGDVLPEVVDEHNHCWDAIRYALAPVIRRAGTGMLDFMAKAAQEVDATKAKELDDRNMVTTGSYSHWITTGQGNQV